MTYNPDIHHRRSIRLREYDYSSEGAYFVTICTWQRECLFGDIPDGEMRLNELGRVVESVWCDLPERFNHVSLDEYVIMPNHFHGIILLADTVGAIPTGRPDFTIPTGRPDFTIPAGRPDFTIPAGRPDFTIPAGRPMVENTYKPGRAVGVAPTGPVSGSIGAIMAQFKSNVTKRLNTYRDNPGCPVWQRNYYERVLRNDDELSHAREYIANNPLKWALDKENPANRN